MLKDFRQRIKHYAVKTRESYHHFQGISISIFLLYLVAAVSSGCATQVSPPLPLASLGSHPSDDDSRSSAATATALARFNENPEGRYTINPGDKVDITVWARPELSGTHVVGPDGDVQLPFLGSLHIADETPDQASVKLSSALSEYYLGAYATLTMLSYSGNSVTVLGQVGNPGLLTFDNNPTLLEVLAKAGGGPTNDKATDIMRCAIFRGRDRAIWLDLRPLYRGEQLALNLTIRRGDIIYVPQPSDRLVYVMGQVGKPGAYQLTPNMSFLDALAKAGGPTDAATPSKIIFARPHENVQQVIDLKTFLAGNGETNYALKEGDIIFVPKSGIAKVGYVLQQLNPITSTAVLGAAIF